MDNIENIIYQLKFVPYAATTTDEDNIRLIAKTLSLLPHDIKERVLSSLTFICLDGCLGQYELLCFPNPSREDFVSIPVVYISFLSMKRRPEKHKMTTVAHEIAHFILGHGKSDGPDKEKQTDDLCESWGFGRAYKEYD